MAFGTSLGDYIINEERRHEISKYAKRVLIILAFVARRHQLSQQ
jgi:hypothetical protein